MLVSYLTWVLRMIFVVPGSWVNPSWGRCVTFVPASVWRPNQPSAVNLDTGRTVFDRSRTDRTGSTESHFDDPFGILFLRFVRCQVVQWISTVWVGKRHTGKKSEGMKLASYHHMGTIQAIIIKERHRGPVGFGRTGTTGTPSYSGLPVSPERITPPTSDTTGGKTPGTRRGKARHEEAGSWPEALGKKTGSPPTTPCG